MDKIEAHAVNCSAPFLLTPEYTAPLNDKPETNEEITPSDCDDSSKDEEGIMQIDHHNLVF